MVVANTHVAQNNDKLLDLNAKTELEKYLAQDGTVDVEAAPAKAAETESRDPDQWVDEGGNVIAADLLTESDKQTQRIPIQKEATPAIRTTRPTTRLERLRAADKSLVW